MLATTTLHTHLANRGVDPALTGLIDDIAIACRAISAMVRHAPLTGHTGSTDNANVHGESQKPLDLLANDVMIACAREHSAVAALVSEEQDDMLALRDWGEYLLVFDPLDGSSNIDVNVSVGTIFSVLPAPAGRSVVLDDFLQPGRRQLAAGYAIYGPTTQLVLTTGDGTHLYTLDPDKRDFLLTQENIRIDETASEFAINASNQRHWEEPVRRYVEECLAGTSGPRGRDFNMRWIASMVAEVHRIMNRGGIFMYPADRREPRKPGRLRLLYEASPMALLVEQAGGGSSDTNQSLLDVSPTSLHQKVPVVLGARSEIEHLESLHIGERRDATSGAAATPAPEQAAL